MNDLIKITARPDVAALMDGCLDWEFPEGRSYETLCDAVWRALGSEIGRADGGAYLVTREELDDFAAAYAA